MKTKHHHISRTQSNYVLRFVKNGVPFQKYFSSLKEAIADRDMLLPAVHKTQRVITPEEHAKQLAQLPSNTSLTGIYIHRTRSGYIVRFNRSTGVYYGGFFRGEWALKEAVAARDALQHTCPPPVKPGRPHKTQRV